MKWHFSRISNLTVFGLFAAVVLCGVVSVDAQKPRKKRQTVKPSSVTQTLTEPQIISRAEDFPDQNSLVVSEPVKPPTTGTTFASDDAARKIEELGNRLRMLESDKRNDYDTKQKRLLLNLDILTRAEQRAESLRKQLWEMIEKENSIRTKMDGLQYDLRPEVIERQISFAGTLRPEELREAKKKSLEAERGNLQNLLLEIQRTKGTVELNLRSADALVEKLRIKLEKDIDTALADEPGN
ncbi:MAG: hypothetical protein ABI539_11230 [Acidobacteriota bacterium]